VLVMGFGSWRKCVPDARHSRGGGNPYWLTVEIY
jgi:hypothetical protein